MCVRFIVVVMVPQECAVRHKLSITQPWCSYSFATGRISTGVRGWPHETSEGEALPMESSGWG